MAVVLQVPSRQKVVEYRLLIEAQFYVVGAAIQFDVDEGVVTLRTPGTQYPPGPGAGA